MGRQHQQPHILMLPFPLLGHIKPMLNIAQPLSHAGLQVTFLNTEHNHHRPTQLQELSTHFPTLHFESISGGLPKDHPRTFDLTKDMVISFKSVTKPLFRETLAEYSRNSDLGPVTCVIVDGIMYSFANDVAKELGIRVITTRPYGACCLWSFCCISKLIEEGHIPVGAKEDLDQEIKTVPGMEGLLRRRDLPSVCRQPTTDPLLQLFIEESKTMTRASGIILNTFDDLEGPILCHIAPLFPNVYTIGPLNALVKTKIGDDIISQCLSSSSNLLEPNNNCLTWLDSKPLRSVVYVSFGSIARVTRGQLLEFWYGLVNSGASFLWVIRHDMIEGVTGDDMIPMELEEATKERGFVVDWAPQEDVLAHSAVGGFFTHKGWNSILESIDAGVPMICWPLFGDHQLNSRWVSEG